MSDSITGNTLKRKASHSPSAEDATPVIKEDAGQGSSNGNAKSPGQDAVNEKFQNANTPAPAGKRAKLGPESPGGLCEPTPLQTPTSTEFGRKSPEQARRSYGSSAPGPERNTGPGAARKSIAPDEKGRARRLFGNINRTLSQTQSGPLRKRTQEVDRRQREGLQKQREELDKARAEKLASRTAIRVQEQERFEEQRMEARHTRMLAMARSLRTRSEPRLYYLPWKPTADQEDMIDDQISAVKETIDRERRELRRKRGISDDNHSHSRKEADPEKHGSQSYRPSGTAGEHKNSLQDTNGWTFPAHAPSNTIKIKDSDDNEEMVQDKEDTVIY